MASNSLGIRISVTVIGMVMLTVLVITYFTYQKTDEIFYKTVEANAVNQLQSTKNSIRLAHESILYHKNSVLTHRKQEIKNHTIIAESVISSTYGKLGQDGIDDATAKEHVLNILNSIRFSNGTGYFWINDTRRPYPEMIMHPTLPELNGKVLDDPTFNCAMGEDKNLFSAFVDACLENENGDGYVDYLWPKPTAHGLTKQQPKISYVRLFRPWNWIIGTGIYIDDIETDVQRRIKAVIRELNQVILKRHTNKKNYFFIFNEDNQMLVHPNLSLINNEVLVNPETGGMLLEELKQAAKSSDKSMEYMWDKPGFEGEYRFEKKVFLTYFAPLKWYIGSSYYKDDLENKIYKLTRWIIAFSFICLILAVLISLLLSNNIVKPLKALTLAALKTGKDGLPPEPLPVTGTRETAELGGTINEMINTVRKSKIKLKESEEKFRAVFNQTFQYIGIVSTDGKMIDINLAALEIAGIDRSEVIGKPLWLTPWWQYSPEMQSKLEHAVSKSAAGELVRFEATHQDKNGRTFFTDFSIKPVRDDRNAVFALIAEGRDITAHKKAETVLRENRENLRTILNSIGDAVIATDVNECVMNMNPVAESLTGWSLNEAEGLTLSEIFHIIDSQTHKPSESPIDKVLTTGKPSNLSQNTMLISKDGTERLIADSCAPIYDTKKHLNGVVLVFRDITEEHALQEQLNHSHKMDAIGQLAGGLAHDINNMLGGIIAGVETLEMQLYDKPESQELLDIIMSASERAGELIKQLLAFARKETIMSTPIDVHTAILNTTALMKRTIDKRIILSCDLKSEKSMVAGDLSQLQNVFLNLGINAVHAMPKGGSLKFTSETFFLDEFYSENSSFELVPGDYIKIEVRDSGCGIPADLLHKVFEPFFTTRKQGEGTGLGLSASYGTVLQHHGAITLQSKAGEGTTFTILLPLSKNTKEKIHSLSLSPITGKGRILFIDDETVIRVTGKKLLRDLGYEVIVAENGREGLDIFTKEYKSIDLVILDMIMPEMNGEDCFIAMREIDPAATIIISSGYTRDADLKDLKVKGLAGLVRKPYRLYDLSKAISNALQQKKK